MLRSSSLLKTGLWKTSDRLVFSTARMVERDLIWAGVASSFLNRAATSFRSGQTIVGNVTLATFSCCMSRPISCDLREMTSV